MEKAQITLFDNNVCFEALLKRAGFDYTPGPYIETSNGINLSIDGIIKQLITRGYTINNQVASTGFGQSEVTLEARHRGGEKITIGYYRMNQINGQAVDACIICSLQID